jgi:quinolinate synthase
MVVEQKTLTTNELKEAIAKLKKEKNAVILAHYYVDEDIQSIADYVGDSLALAQASKKESASIIVFCGVHFMAETAKILNPKAKVLLPDLNAGCSLADSAPEAEFLAFKNQYPDAVVVSYINSSSGVKALSDFICTSSNAVDVVNSIPKDKRIIFAPDKNLGMFVQKVTERDLILWEGACIVHVNISNDKLDIILLNPITNKTQYHFINEVHFSAAMFGSNKDIILKIYNIFYQRFDEFINNNYFIGCDQQTISSIYNTNPELFNPIEINLLIKKNQRIDPWFLLWAYYTF